MSLIHSLGDAAVSALLERGHVSPSRFGEPSAAPSLVDLLRDFSPSRDVLALLSRESIAAATAGNAGDAAALLLFALCVRDAQRPPAAMEDLKNDGS